MFPVGMLFEFTVSVEFVQTLLEQVVHSERIERQIDSGVKPAEISDVIVQRSLAKPNLVSGPNRLFNLFQAAESPNKPVEVTPTVVTPAADAPGAPSAGVPHH